MKRNIILLLLMIFLGAFTTFAQNISTTNVQNLSDRQIASIVQKVKSSGLTMNQAISLAKARGATPTQINQLMSRVQQMNSGPGFPILQPSTHGK